MKNSDSPAGDTVHLIGRYRGGDRAAGNALCTRYYPRVRRIVAVRARAWGLPLEDVEDILQETFLSATKSIENFRNLGEGGFIHWLATIAANRMRDLKKRAHALKCDQDREVAMADMLTPGGSSAGGWQPATDSTRIPDKLVRVEECRFTDACLARLREDYREVILQRKLAGCSWSTVAELQDCGTPDAARKLYARARVALAAEMKRSRGPE